MRQIFLAAFFILFSITNGIGACKPPLIACPAGGTGVT